MNFNIDYSLTTFTSDGKLTQCEYARKAASNGTLSVGCSSSDGIVLASLRLFSPLYCKSQISKIFPVCDTIGMTYSGLYPDFRVIYEKACKLAEKYFEIYGRYPHIDIFMHNIAREIQEYTMRGGKRPFGCLLLIAGYVLDKPVLYQLEPTGSFTAVQFGGVGKEGENAVRFVENRAEMLDDNVVTAVKALREFSGVGIEYEDVDVGVLKDGKFTVLNEGNIKEIFDLLAHK